MNTEFLIDSHCHLYYDPFDDDRAEMMKRAEEAGVRYFLLPNVDLESLSLLKKTCSHYAQKCLPMIGLHPCSVKTDVNEILGQLEAQLFDVSNNNKKNNWWAIGEIGLDFYWDTTYEELQKQAFRKQINWAKNLHLPIAVHARNSLEEVLDILESEQDGNLKGVLHCFSGNEIQAQKGINLGFFLGIGGVVTFKNAGLDKVLPSIPLQSILLETDAPYLAPLPYRGKRNESAFLKIIAEKVAALKEVSFAEVQQITTKNCIELFNLTSIIED